MVSHSYQQSERVFCRKSEEHEWIICIIINCFYSRLDDGNEWPAYTIITSDKSDVTFSVFEFPYSIRKYIDKPIGHIKQSIELGDDADVVKYLVSKYKMDIHLIHKQIIETSLLWGNVSVCAYLNSIKNLFNYNDRSQNVLDDQGRQIVHIAAMKKDHDLLYLYNLRAIFGMIPPIFKALDSKNKSILHYLVMVDNVKYLEHFIEKRLIFSEHLHYLRDNRKISILEWEDSAGKTPSQYASLLKRTKILQILQYEISQVNLTYFLEDIFIHKLNDSAQYDYTTNSYPIITREDIESIHSRYSDVKDGPLSPQNKQIFQSILYCCASKGMLALLQFFNDVFPICFNECSTFEIFSKDPVGCLDDLICFNNKQENIRKKIGVSNSLLNTAILGDLDNNAYLLYCDLDIYDGAYSVDDDGSDGFDYFKISFDKAFERYVTQSMHIDEECSILQFCDSLCRSYLSCNILEVDPKIDILSLKLNIEWQKWEYTRFKFDKLHKNHRILKDLFVHGKVTRMKGNRVQERKETMEFLLSNHDVSWQYLPQLYLFVELDQVRLLFGWFNFNAAVVEEDLECLVTASAKTAFCKSKLDTSQLIHLTKGQFMIIFSILIDEVGSLMSLMTYDGINNKHVGFGIYKNVLHFRYSI